MTDALTGLANRRALMVDLERAFAATPPQSMVLALYRPRRLQGLQRQLRPSRRRRPAAPPRRRAGRRDGALRPRLPARRRRVLRPRLDPDAARPKRSARPPRTPSPTRGDGFSIGASWGKVLIPAEVVDAERRAADRRPADVRAEGPARRLGQQPDPRRPAPRPARARARAGAPPRRRRPARRRLRPPVSLDGEELDVLVRAAELHDIGKIAIPDEILHKAGDADRGRVGADAQAPADRRAGARRRPGPRRGGEAGPLDPRALGRQRLPRRARRPRHPARLPRDPDLRRLSTR